MCPKYKKKLIALALKEELLAIKQLIFGKVAYYVNMGPPADFR